MRIAMIHTPFVHPAGGERQILRLSIELQKRGHEVEIFTNAVDKERCFPEFMKEVTINIVPPLLPLSLSCSPYYIVLGNMLNIGRMIPKSFDIINNHNFPTEWAAFIAKKRLNILCYWS